MKIQCACGAKFAFDITSEQAQQRVHFVCPACGVDSSEHVTNLVRQQFGMANPGSSVAPAIELVAPPPTAASTPIEIVQSITSLSPRVREIAVTPPHEPEISNPALAPLPPARPTPVVRLNRGGAKPTAQAESPVVDERFCSKHPGVRPTEQCVVCGKPICPKCMALFGYVCSPLCNQKAELQGIEVPEYELQKSVVERRRWRKIGLLVGSASGVLALFLGIWFWWAWFGQKPTAIYSTRFEKPAYNGASVLCNNDQIVFLHGSTLARHDIAKQKEIWSVNLVDKAEIARKVEKELKRLHAWQEKLNLEHPDADPVKIPSVDRLTRDMELSAAEQMHLRVVGQNVWVQSPGKIVRYDWNAGTPVKELKVAGGFGGFLLRGDELLMFDEKPYRHIINHINLATAEIRKEEIVDPERPDRSAVANAKTNSTTVAKGGTAPAKTGTSIASRAMKGGAGLPTGVPGEGGGRPIDPKKAEQQYSRLSIPQRLAYPAVLAVQRAQEQALEEMEGPAIPREVEPWPTNQFTFIPAKGGYVEYETHMIEHRTIAHEIPTVEAPKASALDGPVSAGNSIETSIEFLNEMSRGRGGGTWEEDVSRYKVTLRRAPEGTSVTLDEKSAADTKPLAVESKSTATGSTNAVNKDGTWVGEVVGFPSVFALKTVNIVAAKKLIIVFDKDNKKLWQSELAYDFDGQGSVEDDPRRGQGPCVERDNMLFVFDEGMLTAFDLKTGTKRWRLPSVGITGLFFDDAGSLYVSTSTAGTDSIKSRVISLNSGVNTLLLKMDPATGKTLWRRELRGDLAYVFGKYLITMESYWPPDYDDEEGNPYHVGTGLETNPYIRLRRINPRNGKDLWVHYQERCPADVQFDKNRIHLVFKKEVQVLKFRSL